MMRVDQAPEPLGFKDAIHKKGMAWLRRNPNKDPSSYYWERAKLPNGLTCREALHKGYHGICAYSMIRIFDGQSYHVDHFHPKGVARYRKEAYNWGNYRLAGSAWNQRKNARDVQDPFTVPIDACVLRLADGEISYDKKISGWENCQKTIEALGLNEGATRESRKDAYEDYKSLDMGVKRLARDYPFVAYEMLRQNQLKAEDRQPCVDKLHELGFSWVRG